ncbi:MAG: hypothetical protein WAM14_25390 [Candidatus Nitrosopolaris sp.]
MSEPMVGEPIEDEDIEITMTHEIAEALHKNGLDARRAEPIFWILLSSVYRLLKKRDGITTYDIEAVINGHKKVLLKEWPIDVDKRLEELL